MPRISSLITKGFRTPDVEPGFWQIPQGALIMYSGAADPGLLGWTRYSAADGKFIKGTATQAEIGTITANNNSTWQSQGYSSGTSSQSDHTGPAANYQQSAPAGAVTSGLTTVIYYPGTGGAHAHTVVWNVGTGTDFNPASTSYVLLQATQVHKKLPVNTVLGRSTQPTSSTQEISSTYHRYITGGTAYANTTAATRTFNGSTSSYGPHVHDSSSYIGRISGGSTNTALGQTPNSVTAVSHTHSSTGTITSTGQPGKLLKLWKLVAELIPQDNIIIMYTGNISSLPNYWKVCDGTNGTPNMVNYFLGYSLVGTAHDTSTAYSSSVSSGGLSTESWTHSHITATQTSRVGYPTSNQHTSTSVSHSHTLTTNPTGSLTSSNVYQPDEIKVCFIQLTKTLY